MQNKKAKPDSPEKHAGYKTVLSVFKSVGERGKMALCGGLAARILMAPRKTHDHLIDKVVGKSKDIDLYVLKGNPFGEHTFPHEWLHLDLKDHPVMVPAEVIYSPARYFGFVELKEEHCIEITHSTGTRFLVVSPEFYSASVLNSIPYKQDAIAMVGRLRHAFTLDSVVINGLLADSRLLMLFPTGWDEFRAHPGGRKSISEFSRELEKRAMLAVKARTPFLLKLPLDAKSAFDSLLFDDQTADLLGNGYENETRNVTYVEDKIRGIAKRVFPKSYYEQSGSSVVDMLIREIKSEFIFKIGTITPGSAAQACRMLWGYLEIMDVRRDEDAFISAAKRWTEAQGLRSASPLYDFLRAQATRAMSVEKTAMFFRLLNQTKKIGMELWDIGGFHDFGISLVWAMRDCPVFMVTSAVEAELSVIEEILKTGNTREAKHLYSRLGETVLNVHRYALRGGDLWSDNDVESPETNGK